MKRELLITLCSAGCALLMIGIQHYGGSELRGIDGFYTYALFYLMFKN